MYLLSLFCPTCGSKNLLIVIQLRFSKFDDGFGWAKINPKDPEQNKKGDKLFTFLKCKTCGVWMPEFRDGMLINLHRRKDMDVFI